MLPRLLFVAVAMAAAAGAVHAADPSYDFKLKKADDSITAAKDGDKTVFTITGKSGIGAGTITLKEGQWPKEVVLRFRYNDTDAFKTLEQIQLNTAKLKVSGSQKQSKAMPYFKADADGKFGDKP